MRLLGDLLVDLLLDVLSRILVGRIGQLLAESADIILRLWRVLKPRLVAERMTAVYETLERPLTLLFDEAVHAPDAADRLGLADGDLGLYVADVDRVSGAALDRVRQELARRLDLVPRGGALAFVWVYDFPMFERDPSSGWRANFLSGLGRIWRAAKLMK